MGPDGGHGDGGGVRLLSEEPFVKEAGFGLNVLAYCSSGLVLTATGA